MRRQKVWALELYWNLFLANNSIMELGTKLFKDTEAVLQRCSVKKVALEISQNSLKSTCARVSFLIKLLGSGLRLYYTRLWRRSFPVNFAKFLRTPFHRTPLVAASEDTLKAFNNFRNEQQKVYELMLFDM